MLNLLHINKLIFNIIYIYKVLFFKLDQTIKKE